MKVVVTEAASTLAYHLVQILASGDIIQDQPIDLILCDIADKEDVVTGVAYELQDSVFPALSSIQTSTDLCAEFKTADVAIVLPKLNDEGVPKDLEVDFTELKELDFHVLDGVFHPAGIMTQDTCRFSCRGVLSTAISVANCLHRYHQTSLQEIEKSTCTMTYPEEAEFGMVDYTQYDGDVSPWLGCVQEGKLLLVLIRSDNSVIKDDIKQSNISERDVYLFLSRL